MAVVWQNHKNGTHYEVRRAGNSVRLYTNGVFHSQWNKTRPFAGHLWDLLFLPMLFNPSPEQVNRALLLGVGGGAVINLLQYFVSAKKIVGVDLDKTHLSIAKKFFIESMDNVELIHEDAQTFVDTNKQYPYDFILEDLFCGDAKNPSEAVRPITVDADWLGALSQQLTSDGVLAINFESRLQLRNALRKQVLRDCGFQALYCFQNPRYENAVAACSKSATTKKVFQKNLETIVLTSPKKRTKDLHFLLTKI